MKKRWGIIAGLLLATEGIMAGVALADDNYGAIATSSSGAWGYAYDYSSRQAAENAALQQCGESGCKVQVWFKNACGAVAKDGTNLGWGWALTREQAEANALSYCGTEACKVQVWACTTR